MQKKAILTWLFCICIGFAGTHAVDFGVRAGLNFSNVPSSQEIALGGTTLANHYLEVSERSHTGFHFGVFANLSFANIFIQPEFLFEETGQVMIMITDHIASAERETNRFTPRFSHVKIPVTAGMKFAIFRIGAGPYYSYLLDNTRADLQVTGTGERISFQYKESRMGYQVMAGICVGNISLDYRFEGGFTRLGDGARVGGESYDFRINPRQHIISLGIAVF